MSKDRVASTNAITSAQQASLHVRCWLRFGVVRRQRAHCWTNQYDGHMIIQRGQYLHDSHRMAYQGFSLSYDPGDSGEILWSGER